MDAHIASKEHLRARDMLDPIFNGDEDHKNGFLRFISRGLAGMVVDKLFGIGLGLRDCGKGMLVNALTAAFRMSRYSHSLILILT